MSLKADKVLHFGEILKKIYSEILYVDVFVGDAE